MEFKGRVHDAWMDIYDPDVQLRVAKQYVTRDNVNEGETGVGMYRFPISVAVSCDNVELARWLVYDMGAKVRGWVLAYDARSPAMLRVLLDARVRPDARTWYKLDRPATREWAMVILEAGYVPRYPPPWAKAFIQGRDRCRDTTVTLLGLSRKIRGARDVFPLIARLVWNTSRSEEWQT